jgi:hypothetical protein
LSPPWLVSSKKKWRRAARLTTRRFLSFSANPWILKAYPSRSGPCTHHDAP